MSDTILAVHLGRYKSLACAYDRRTRAHQSRATDTTRDDIGRLPGGPPGAGVVVEACANPGWAHDLAAAAGPRFRVANPTAEAWKFRHLKRKTDKDDAKRLAE